MIGLLAQAPTPPPPPQNNFGDDLSDGVAGPMALLIIVVLIIATVLLVRNMNTRLRRLPAEFPRPAVGTGGAGLARSGDAVTTAGGTIPGQSTSATNPASSAQPASRSSPDSPVDDS